MGDECLPLGSKSKMEKPLLEKDNCNEENPENENLAECSINEKDSCNHVNLESENVAECTVKEKDCNDENLENEQVAECKEKKYLASRNDEKLDNELVADCSQQQISNCSDICKDGNLESEDVESSTKEKDNCIDDNLENENVAECSMERKDICKDEILEKEKVAEYKAKYYLDSCNDENPEIKTVPDGSVKQKDDDDDDNLESENVDDSSMKEKDHSDDANPEIKNAVESSINQKDETGDKVLDGIEIISMITISDEDFYSGTASNSPAMPESENTLSGDKPPGADTLKKEEKSRASESSSNGSPPVLMKKGLAYDYTRVNTSPVDIAIPEIEEEEVEEAEQSDDECDSLVSAIDNVSVGAAVDDILAQLDTDVEDEETAPIVTDINKYYKITHEDQLYFIKAERAQASSCSVKLELETTTLSECAGCNFKMHNITAPHDCIPNFCVPCQVPLIGDCTLHIVENHMADMKTCPFCNEAFSSLQQLENHLMVHTSLKIRPSICLGCKKKFQTLEGRTSHLCDNAFICQVCNIIFSTTSQLMDHQETQHKNEQQVEIKCAKRNEAKSISTEELEEGESEDGSHICQICDKKFAELQTLDKHVSWHFTIPEEDLKGLIQDQEPTDDEITELSDESEQESIRCLHCTFTAPNLKALNEHLCSSKFCKHCLTQCGGAHEFEAHMVEYHCSEKKCQFCDAEFKSSNGLIDHMQTHTKLQIRPFCCTVCKNNFGKEENLINHKCQGKGPSSKSCCMVCKIYFQSEGAQINHLVEHHSQDNYCPICKDPQYTVQSLLSHVVTHFNGSSKITSYCRACNEEFEDGDFYKHHCPDLTKEEPAVDEEAFLSTDSEHIAACSICGKEFPNDEELETHISKEVEKATEIALKKFCSFCQCCFATRSSFESHMIQYHLSTLQCPFCLTYLSPLKAMEQHLLHHTNIHRLPNQCKTCSKFYFSKGLFDNHSCDSGSEEDTKSQIIDLKLTPKKEIEDRQNTESIVSHRKMYYCPVCNKGFKGKKYLEEVHLATHTGKVFECRYCQRQLNSAATLGEHLKLHEKFKAVKSSPEKDRELLATLPVPLMSVPNDLNKCIPCRRIFSSNEAYEKHNLIHSYSSKVMDKAKSKVFCKLCNCKMESLFWAAYHYTSTHNIISALKHQCYLCKVNFGTIIERAAHFCPKRDDGNSTPMPEVIETKIKEEPMDVDDVDMDFNKYVLPSVRKGRPVKLLKVDPLHMEHPCSHCKDIFVNAKTLADHCIKSRYCTKCKKTFDDTDAYEQHMMYMHSFDGNQCTFCNKKYQHLDGLKKHLKAHTKLKHRLAIQGKFFSCRSCGQLFKAKRWYDVHNIQNHVLNEKVCSFCYVNCYTTERLKKHISKHTDIDVHKILSRVEKSEDRNEKPVATPTVKESTSDSQVNKSKVQGKPLKNKPIVPAKTQKTPAAVPVSTTKAKKPAPTTTASIPSQNSIERKSSRLDKESASSQSVKPRVLVEGDKCLLCNKKMSLPALYDHVMEKHWNKSTDCPFCEKSWYSTSNTKAHIFKYHLPHMTGRTSETVENSSMKSSKSLASNQSVNTKNSSLIPPESEKSGPLLCNLCLKGFSTKKVLDNHIRSEHHIEPAKAQLLEKSVFPGTSSSSATTSGPDKKTFCFHCHTSFNTEAELRAHGTRVGIYCQFCKFTLPDTNEYEMHMLEEHPMEDICQFCGAYIPNKAGLEIHIRKHTNIGPIHYKCFGCNEMFRSCKEKDNHPCVAFACPKCKLPQRGPDGLDEHMKLDHGSPEPSITITTLPKKRGRPPKKVDLCDDLSPLPSDNEVIPTKKIRSEGDSSSLSSTQRSEGKKLSSTWICAHCDRSFPDSASLIKHAIPFGIFCNVCNQVFATKAKRITHQSLEHKPEISTKRSPQNKQPAKKVPDGTFACHFCGDQFNLYVKYDEHVKTHVTHQCKKCYKVFDNESSLKSHVLEHGEKAIKTVKIESDSDDDILIIENEKPAKAQFVML